MRDFKRLQVWQRSHRLAVDLHREADAFTGRNRFGLAGQLTRAAESIPANIAEGAGRESVKEFRRFLTIAIGSAAELENHLMLARELGQIGEPVAKQHLDELAEIMRMISGLRRRVRT